MDIRIATFALSALLIAGIASAPVFGQTTSAIAIITDQESYTNGDTITVTGNINANTGDGLTIQVISPTGNIVAVGQADVASDGAFETTIATGSLWSVHGAYTIKVQYGDTRSGETTIEFTAASPPDTGGTGDMEAELTSEYLFTVGEDEVGIRYDSGTNTIVAMAANLDSKSLVIEVDVANDGEIVIALPRHLIDAKDQVSDSCNADGADVAYIVLVDGEETWVTEVAREAARTLTIPVNAGAQEIEIFGTCIVPEFGTIAILILAAAIVSIIVVSGRTRLSIMPRY
ncbi:hypothetical protein GBAR_LOCUS21819 [Geodia barretti]|uniref:PEFG-CTERM sorting domain-containing protein n=1 Tax=Geodia barretti TaxID=519541 RepID=A0AA35SZZ8_GEOBA|nr:hypothetical protein GBAR_LOCUS21819 [Geodia barretti]